MTIIVLQLLDYNKLHSGNIKTHHSKIMIYKLLNNAIVPDYNFLVILSQNQQFGALTDQFRLNDFTVPSR